MDVVERPAEGTAPARVTWPTRFLLAKHWEAHTLIRAAFRLNDGKLLSWVSPQLVGVASLRALSINKLAIQLTLEKWCATTSTPKSPPVDWLKQEARVHVWVIDVI